MVIYTDQNFTQHWEIEKFLLLPDNTKEIFQLVFFWHFLWVHAFNQVYNSDKTFPKLNELWSGVPASYRLNSNTDYLYI